MSKFINSITSNFKKLKNDWKISTSKERKRFVIVSVVLNVSGIVAVCFLLSGINNENYNEVMLSYMAFVILTVVSRVNTTPKARMEIDKEK